jgi:pilus assembly protein Flp/PilA
MPAALCLLVLSEATRLSPYASMRITGQQKRVEYYREEPNALCPKVLAYSVRLITTPYCHIADSLSSSGTRERFIKKLKRWTRAIITDGGRTAAAHRDGARLGRQNAVMLRLSNEVGQTMAEYGLIIALVAVVVIVGVTAFGANLLGYWDALANAIMGKMV